MNGSFIERSWTRSKKNSIFERKNEWTVHSFFVQFIQSFNDERKMNRSFKFIHFSIEMNPNERKMNEPKMNEKWTFIERLNELNEKW
jgi:hypothetical protein